MNQREIDIREKNSEDIFKAYEQVAKESLEAHQAWEQTQNVEEAVLLYQKKQEEKKDSEKSRSK